MTSLAGCSGESFASILRALGYVSEQRKGPSITVPLLTAAPAEHQAPQEAELAEAAAASPDSSAGAEALEPPLETQPNAEPPAEAAAVPVLEAISQECGAAPADKVETATSGLAGSETAPAPTDPAGTASSGEAAAVEETLIEVWHPHRPQPHHRRPDARARKKHFERRGEAPATAPAAASEKGAHEAPPCGVAAGEALESAGTGQAALAQGRSGSPPMAFKGRHRDGGKRSEGEQKPRFGAPRGRWQAGEQNRSAAAGKPGEGRGERFGAREKRPAERPLDPNSPFAKLLVLKAQLEEKTRQEKDNQGR